MRFPDSFKLTLVLLLVLPAVARPATLCTPGAGPRLPNPILFVAQVPIPADFATVGSTFANHFAAVAASGRGGDLYIRYPDGTLCNLTREAGFGSAGEFQGPRSIAVRDPSVHWSGEKALFSMAVGAPAERYRPSARYWQIYEVTGLGRGERAVVRRVPRQPADYNNLSPIYAPGGRIVFTSDRARNGARHLYPQLDEYESTPTVTGLWSLHPESGGLRLLDHAPSGAFTPILDSFGRVVYTRWDHLQRDQQADGDAVGAGYGTFDYAHEGPGAARLDRRLEQFPEPRPVRADLLAPNESGHRFNHFFPWQVNPDGTEVETLNHVGRHELHEYFTRSFTDDASLVDFLDDVSGRFNPRPVANLFQIEEDPSRKGLYYGVDAPEFGTHASGRVVRLVAPPQRPADRIRVAYVTHPSTVLTVGDGEAPPGGHSGHYRDPLPLANGVLVAAHTRETRYAANEGSRRFPVPRYDFRLKKLEPGAGAYLAAGAALTPGLHRRVRYWDPDEEVTYDGPLWELSPVEVRRRPPPPARRSRLEAPEARTFAEAGVDVERFRRELRRRGLALVVSRDVTTRDAADRQQPVNLRVAGSATSTARDGGKLYEVAYVQFFQGDQVRGIGGLDSPDPGRRVLARPLHHPTADNPPAPDGPPGSVAVAADGSMAALVPARRALSWQLTDADGVPVVRERYWLTFQSGEIRVCTSCHGLNRRDQAGRGRPANRPQALADLLRHWKN